MSINDATPAEWDALPAGQKKWVKVDVIDKPEHYNKGGVEAIDYIKPVSYTHLRAHET